MRQPAFGEKFWIGKEKPCQVILWAKEKETGRELLIYQELFGSFERYAADAAEMSNYFSAEKKEQITIGSHQPDRKSKRTAERENAKEQPEELLMEFLDADTIEEKYHILIKAHNASSGRLTENFLSAAAFSIDCVLPEGEIEERFQALKYFLATKRKYER